MNIIVLAFLLLASACGNHQQSLFRVEAKENIQDVGEDSDELELIKAVNGGDIDRIKHFFDKGISKNLYNRDGLTLIMIAVKSLQYGVLEFLIEQGADVDLRSKADAKPPNHSAIEFLEALDTDESIQLDPMAKEVMLALLEGKKIDGVIFNEFPDANPNSNMIYASILAKNVGLLKFMLDKGGDPNLVTEDDKSTPLLHLFALFKGAQGQVFAQVAEVFEALVAQPSIDVDLMPARARANALCRAQQLKNTNSEFQYFIDRLKALGATPIGRRCDG